MSLLCVSDYINLYSLTVLVQQVIKTWTLFSEVVGVEIDSIKMTLSLTPEKETCLQHVLPSPLHSLFGHQFHRSSTLDLISATLIIPVNVGYLQEIIYITYLHSFHSNRVSFFSGFRDNIKSFSNFYLVVFIVVSCGHSNQWYCINKLHSFWI